MKYLAQNIENPILKSSPLGNISGEGFLQKFIPSMVGLVFVVGSLLFFFMLLIGAVQWIASGGEKAALEEARNKIVNAVIGFVILVSVFAVIKIIESFFGINILTIDIGPLKL